MDVIGEVGTYMGKVGLRPDDLADAIAIYVMDSWEASNGQQLKPDRERAQAVRRQMVRAILSTPEMAAASDATKQELAESMLVQTALVGSAYLTAVQQGDAAVIAAVSDAARKGAQATLGIDLRQMTITNAGLRQKAATDSGN